jgi:hypothetical protein
VTPDKTTAPAHETPRHFNPVARELLQSPIWRSIFDNASYEDKKDLWFVIRNHMNLLEGGLKKEFLRRFIKPNGKYINNRRLKLLLTFMIMDRSGRKVIDPSKQLETIPSMKQDLAKGSAWVQKINTKPTEPAPNDPVEFVKMWLQKGKRMDILPQSLQGKFKREFSPEEIQELIRLASR